MRTMEHSNHFALRVIIEAELCIFVMNKCRREHPCMGLL